MEAEGVTDADDVVVVAPRPLNPGRTVSRVEREDLELRLPRSAPDALRYEPGVFVQKTAHGQGSAFVRGRTGQQTVLLFDEVRLNNSLFRQGPNQYFFTIDSRTIDHIEVLRGSASTRYGSDAIGGVIGAFPVEPTIRRSGGFVITPRLSLRTASADNEIGGRGAIDAQLGPVGIVAGAGYRTVGLLESGGIVRSPVGDELPEVPRFDIDERTQLGTGFDEFAGDVRVVYPFGDYRAVVAWYEYRQFDAPRTDQCAPPFAPFNECLQYDEQFRSLWYGSLDGDLGPFADDFRLLLSVQRQHERRTHERPSSFVINGGRDDVVTLGSLFRAETDWLVRTEPVRAKLRYGGDLYHDQVESVAWLEFTDLEIVRNRTRGQYLDDSTYSWGGVFSEAEAVFADLVVVRTGGRVAFASADAPGDPESGTLPVDQRWDAAVGNVGLELWATNWLTLTATADQAFRAPNLDDLTSRQQTGPGFQFENADLEPERALSLEAGAQVVFGGLQLDGWLYQQTLTDAIARAPRLGEECPPNTTACNNSWSQFQLVNLPGEAVIVGWEGSAKLELSRGFETRATIAWARGDGPNPADRPSDPSLPYKETVPLSRIPPLNGTAEVLWRSPQGLYVGAGLRWARSQGRLAESDNADERIPRGGTPGFAVIDARVGYRFDNGLLALSAENLTDAAYRYHGSSVNGPARGLVASLDLSY